MEGKQIYSANWNGLFKLEIMNQEINATIELVTAPVNPQEDIEKAVRRAFGDDFNIQSVKVDDANSNAVIKMEVITEADAELGNYEVVQNMVLTIEGLPFRSIASKVLSLKEEAEIYGNV
jgi:hypothetical protein